MNRKGVSILSDVYEELIRLRLRKQGTNTRMRVITGRTGGLTIQEVDPGEGK